MNGDDLRALRTAAGLSLEEMATLTGRSFGHLGHIERGARPAVPDLVTAYQRAASLDPMERRQLLVGALGVPFLTAPSRVGRTDVDDVVRVAQNLTPRSPYALALAEYALAQAQHLAALPMPAAYRAEMRAAVGLISAEMAYGRLELRRDPSDALDTAHRAAIDSHDGDLLAMVLRIRAMATVDRARATREAERAADAADSGAARARSLALAARLCPNPGVARRTFRRATDVEASAGTSIVSRRTGTDGTPWDLAEMAAAAFAIAAPNARAWLTRALDVLPQDAVSTRARTNARLAILALREREAADAERFLTVTLEAPRTASVRAALAAVARTANEAGYADLAGQAAGR
jgi:transcriptional regulator with XRE-family HTH domain